MHKKRANECLGALMQDDLLSLAYEVSATTEKKVELIDGIMGQARFLAINARIEAARAGIHGAGFSVLADEMGKIAGEIVKISADLRAAIAHSTDKLRTAGADIVLKAKEARFTDLALNAIELIDRNLYERSCDVRWWATDAAVVEALEAPSPETIHQACTRLGIILKSYTVYLDLFIADANGVIIACGRPEKYKTLLGSNVSKTSWFRKALKTSSGDEYCVEDIRVINELHDAQTAVYATAVRGGGDEGGNVLGALGIAFDWAPQAEAIVKGVRLSDEDKKKTRVMLVDRQQRVIASSDGNGVLKEVYSFTPSATRGTTVKGDKLVAFALTPGYETYKGLGWYGVIETPL